ncbi:MAG TPA: hypothetical protein VEH82_01035, partial [Acidimicrobiales bacterium]|nr:hypothetical protein [Acidimicrobiales bacterium]
MSTPPAVSDLEPPAEPTTASPSGALASAAGTGRAPGRPTRRAEILVVVATMVAVGLAWALIPKGAVAHHPVGPAPASGVTTVTAKADGLPPCTRDPVPS